MYRVFQPKCVVNDINDRANTFGIGGSQKIDHPLVTGQSTQNVFFL